MQRRPTHIPHKILSIWLAIVMLIPLSACAAQPTRVSLMVYGEPAEYAAYQALVNTFHHPEIEIELIYVPAESEHLQRLSAELAAGNPPDVVLLSYRHYAAFASQGAFEPLEPYLAESVVVAESDYYPQAVKAFTWNGELICMPQELSSLVVYYNKSLFDQAGLPYPTENWTWAGLRHTALALTQDTDGDGQPDQFGLGLEPTLTSLAPFFWQGGGEVVDDPSNPTRLALDTPETLRAVQFLANLAGTDHALPNLEEETTITSQARFMSGSLAMYLGGRHSVPTFREISTFEWDVALLPHDLKWASILYTDGYCLTSASQHKQAAWAFIEYANSHAGQRVLAATGLTVPSLYAVTESAAFLDTGLPPASNQVFIDALPYLRTLPILPNWAEIEQVADQELARAFYGQASPAEAALEAAGRSAPYFAP